MSSKLFTLNLNQKEDQRQPFTSAAGSYLPNTRFAVCAKNIDLIFNCLHEIYAVLEIFSTPENKRDFTKAVQSILRDKQRRQLLKTESLPQSQQYMPFGGKRLCALKGARPVVDRAGKHSRVSSKINIISNATWHRCWCIILYL